MKGLLVSSGEVADCNQMNTPPLILPFQACRRTYGSSKTHKKGERPSLEPVFGLSVLGYCRNMAVQHGGLCRRGPAPYVDIKGKRTFVVLSEMSRQVLN